LKGRIVGHIPTTNPDGSIVWEYLILTEGGELDRVSQEMGDAWLAKMTSPSTAEATVESFNTGDDVVVVSSGKAGSIVMLTGSLAELILQDGSRVSVNLSDLKRAS
jgi:hypothetical protein